MLSHHIHVGNGPPPAVERIKVVEWPSRARHGSNLAQTPVFFGESNSLDPESRLSDRLLRAPRLVGERTEEGRLEHDRHRLTPRILETERDQPVSLVVDEAAHLDPVLVRRDDQPSHETGSSSDREAGQC